MESVVKVGRDLLWDNNILYEKKKRLGLCKIILKDAYWLRFQTVISQMVFLELCDIKGFYIHDYACCF